jgi:hypothetical protein
MKDPLKNKILKIKGKTDKALLHFEVRKFFKDPLFWFVSVFNLIMVAQQIYWIYTHIIIFPAITPILNYNLSPGLRLASKEFCISFQLSLFFL